MWIAMIGAAIAGGVSATAAPPTSWTDGLGDWSDPSSPLGAAIDEAGKRDALSQLLMTLSEQGASADVLPPVQSALGDPLRADQIALEYAALLDGVEENPFGVVAQAAAKILGVELTDPTGQGELDVMHIRAGVNAMNFLTNGSDYLVREAFGETHGDEDLALQLLSRAIALAPPGEDPAVDARLQEFVSTLDIGGLVNAIEHYQVGVALNADFESGQLYEDPPAELAAAFEGTIVAFDRIREIGWVVVGGVGDNRYDMGVISAVIDPDGDDEYYMSKPRLGSSLIIDAAGNDRYRGHPQQGPGGALFGVSVIDDRAGDDIYEGGQVAFGAGVAGVGVLLDRGGSDRYTCRAVGLGSGLAGVGALLDLGDGDDVYTAATAAMGVGLSRGFGYLYDAGGDDSYLADLGVERAITHGVGLAWREMAGGVGILRDGGGDDQYLSGIGQGVGLNRGLGVLIDDAGDDRYMSRFGMSGAGLAGVGVSIDHAGSDVRMGRPVTSASQGVVVLRDLAGEDVTIAPMNATPGQAAEGIVMLIHEGPGAVLLQDNKLGEQLGDVVFLLESTWANHGTATGRVIVPRSPKVGGDSADQ